MAVPTQDYHNYFMNDKSEYSTFIGNSRSSDSTYADRFNGFIYDFHIYQIEYSLGMGPYHSGEGGCFDGPGATHCWQVE